MGKKKDAATHGLSKKAKRKLEERAAELAAELKRREKADKKKAKKKADKATLKKGKKAARAASVELDAALIDAGALGTMTIEAEAPIVPEPTDEEAQPEYTDAEKAGIRALVEAHADIEPKKVKKSKRDEVITEDGTTRPEVIAERKAVRDETQAALDAEIKARVQAKKAAREEGKNAVMAEADSVDRSDDAAVKAYNLRAVAVGATLLTSDTERERIAGRASTVEEVETLTTPVHVAEEIETEKGREFAVGGPVPALPDFAKPSESADNRPDFETNGLNQYKVKRPSDGKMVGYTRVTTYIACLEDTSKLTEWKLRVLLEGVAASEELGDRDGVTSTIRELAHARDMAIAKARKADRKGKLGVGDLAVLTDRAWSVFKKAMNTLADEVFEIGGGREKAAKGTDIHSLTELHDREGIGAVGDLLTAGQITPADMADVEAYAEAMRKLGAKIVERERVVVNDDLKVAGRLDTVAMVKLPALHDPKTGEVIRPAEARARRRVIDLKTGRIDYGIGKLAQQLEMYAGSTGYDLETHDREDLKLDRTVGLVIHLPAGSGKATVHVVDLVAGRKGNKLASEVRSWRNEGKRAANLSIDVLAEIDRAESEAE